MISEAAPLFGSDRHETLRLSSLMLRENETILMIEELGELSMMRNERSEGDILSAEQRQYEHISSSPSAEGLRWTTAFCQVFW